MGSIRQHLGVVTLELVENTVLKNAVASALGGEAVNWSALQSVSALPRDNMWCARPYRCSS